MDTHSWVLRVSDVSGGPASTRQLLGCCKDLTDLLRGLSMQTARVGESQVSVTADTIRIKVDVYGGPNVRAMQVVSSTIRKHGLLAFPLVSV